MVKMPENCAGALEPVGLDFELGGIGRGLAGGRVGDALEAERCELAAGHGDEFDRRGLDADEVLGVAVEDQGGEFAGGRVAEEFEVVGVFADLDRGAAVRRGVDVLGVVVGRVIVTGVIVPSPQAARTQRAAAASVERRRVFIGEGNLENRAGKASGRWRISAPGASSSWPRQEGDDVEVVVGVAAVGAAEPEEESCGRGRLPNGDDGAEVVGGRVLRDCGPREGGAVVCGEAAVDFPMALLVGGADERGAGFGVGVGGDVDDGGVFGSMAARPV